MKAYNKHVEKMVGVTLGCQQHWAHLPISIEHIVLYSIWLLLLLYRTRSTDLFIYNSQMVVSLSLSLTLCRPTFSSSSHGDYLVSLANAYKRLRMVWLP